MAQLAILCPGQGRQHPRMFDVLGLSSNAHTLLEHWSMPERLSMPLDMILANETLLFSNRLAQPLIVAATLSVWEKLKHELPAPTVVLGYSVGELSAYAVAGAIAPAATLMLADIRAQLMDASAQSSPPQALLAVTGLDLMRISDTAARAGLSVAIETGHDSAVVGGLQEEVQNYAVQLAQEGIRTVMLPVGVASHTPLMNAAVAPFLEALGKHRLSDPTIPVVSGLTGATIRNRDEASRTLARQISETIRWKDCMDTCAETGITVALELGPGGALARMLHGAHPHIECRSIDDFRSVDGVVRWIRRHFDQ
ncbi:ACP S-malonyltransferase [Noviherbaspirillum sp. Root189]|uniref:ACP S-malonyltransferase n=1 Tax=Noviherbaspirillum sp. Root189 TaxID=1736487 RepID=UPI00071115FA|nr:acyltransferase domain-containing protein [Noviherbaspirillum sp. Root189]KRB84003.1 malonyl CoA-ACP transacylase [Noviherbaspirillum sp. Root189]